MYSCVLEAQGIYNAYLTYNSLALEEIGHKHPSQHSILAISLHPQAPSLLFFFHGTFPSFLSDPQPTFCKTDRHLQWCETGTSVGLLVTNLHYKS